MYVVDLPYPRFRKISNSALVNADDAVTLIARARCEACRLAGGDPSTWIVKYIKCNMSDEIVSEIIVGLSDFRRDPSSRVLDVFFTPDGMIVRYEKAKMLE